MSTTAKRVRSKKSITKSKKKKLIRRPFRLRWLVGIVVIGAVFSWIAGWWTFDVADPGGTGVSLNIVANEIASAGEEITVEFVINNSENVDLTNVELSVQWPEGVRIISSSVPTINDSKSAWNLDNIATGSESRVEVLLQLFGEEKDVKQINATLIYELQNFSSDFFAEAVHDITIGDQTITVEFDDVGDIPPLTKTDWRIVATVNKPVGDNDFLNIILPKGLEEVEVQPDVDLLEVDGSDVIRYSLADKSVGEKIIIKVTGQFAAGTQGKKLFVWQFGKYDGEFSVIQEGEFEQFVIGDEVEIEVLLNKEEKLESLNWGDVLDITLIVRNITSDDLENLEWSLNITPDVVDWNAVTSDFKTSLDSLGVVRFFPEDNESMQTLGAGEEMKIGLKIPIKSLPTQTDKLQGSARLRIIGQNESDALSFSKTFGPISLKQSAKWYTSARYFSDEGVQVGTGPLPPKVGEQTIYRIQWNISGVDNNSKNVSVFTTLPPYVSWSNQFSVNFGTISYNATDRSVVWNIPDIDTYNFSANGELQAEWEIGFIPTSDHKGRVIPLTQITTLKLTDTSDKVRTLVQPAVTTSLEGDIYAGNKGVVIE